MKDKIYKLNRPKGFHTFKRALIAATSIFMGSVAVAVPLSIALYTSSNAPETVEVEVKKSQIVEEDTTLKSEDPEELLEEK